MSPALRPAAAIAIIATVFFATGCGTVVDQAKLDDATQASLEDSLHEKIKTVDCPSDLPVEPGSTFTCDVTFPDGQPQTATLEIRNKDADISIVGLKPTQ